MVGCKREEALRSLLFALAALLSNRISVEKPVDLGEEKTE
jgi:hypothetical protein